jgi:hypothetical protein
MKQVRLLIALLVIVTGGMGAWVWKVREQLDAARKQLDRAEATKAAALARKDRDQQEAVAALNAQHQKDLESLKEQHEKDLNDERNRAKQRATEAYKQIAGIMEGDQKTLNYINLIEEKVRSGAAVSKAEADKVAAIANGLSYLTKQYQKPFEDFRELQKYLEKKAGSQANGSVERSGFWQRLFSKEVRERDKENEREYYRTEGQRQAFREAKAKFATAYSSAQKKMAAVNIDAEKAIADINAFADEKRGSVQDLTDFFNQARKALNAHQKLLDVEPDISKPVIEGAKQ